MTTLEKSWAEEKRHIVQARKELKKQYGKNITCGDCFWYCPESGNERKGICGATRFDIPVTWASEVCPRFEK